MPRAALALAVCLLVVCAPREAAAKWTTLRSPNFLFVGDASERQIRTVAQRLEEFREALARVLPGNAGASPVSTTVVVFQTDAGMASYRPQFQGKAVEVAGYFLGSEDANYIAVSVERGDAAFRTIFHEYSHFLVSTTTGSMPVWFNEGIAEVYSTFEERKGGRSALIGLAPAEHVMLLRESTLMPLRDLLAVTNGSPVYNEGSRRGVFYAQSWALMHYLMLGNKERANQLTTYLASLRDGAADAQAFRDAFGESREIEGELGRYLRNTTFPGIRFDFTENIGDARVGRGEPMSDAESRAYLGDLLVRLKRPDEGRAMLTALLKERPESVRAALALAMLHIRENHVDDALAVLKPAAMRASSDAAIQTAYGRALLTRISEQRDGDTDSLRAEARAALTRAVEADSTSVLPLALLGYLELQIGSDLPRATSLLEKAVQLAPAREQYRLMLAEALMTQRDFARATTYLGPLLAYGQTKETRDAARQRLGVIGNMQRPPSTSQRAASGDETHATAALPTNTAPAQAASADASLVPRTSLMSVLEPDGGLTPIDTGGLKGTVPALRVVAADETRVLGMFVAADCLKDGVVLHVAVDGRTLRLTARGFDDVEFIAYVENPPQSIPCGVFGTASRVLATYRALAGAAAGIDGQAVAIELIPAGFTPR
jgi:Tfp pilus assembly protein PilF